MILADTSVWIDHFADRETPQTGVLARVLAQGDGIVGDLILGEVLQGTRFDREFRETRSILLGFPVVAIVDTHIAIQAAANYRLLRQRGITVRGTIDALIATWCIENDAWLLHDDRDFDHFEEHLGLKVVH
ncbi:MAG: PIN domain nuclease [Armatimonadota bacterium]|nr:PIN domain nuclease [Armatimonadota bacterium]